MRHGLILVGLFCVSTPVGAQASTTMQPAQTTSPVEQSRFEVVQSPIALRFTFRLDRYTGKVWQLTNARGNEWHWEETIVPELNGVSAGRPRFQLIVASIALSHTLLVDTETGKTWQFRSHDATYSREPSRAGYGWEVLLER